MGSRFDWLSRISQPIRARSLCSNRKRDDVPCMLKVNSPLSRARDREDKGPPGLLTQVTESMDLVQVRTTGHDKCNIALS